MLDAGQQVALRHTIASQLVGHDRPRHILQTLQQPPEEALRGVGIAPGLNQTVERDTILIDGASEIVLHAADPDEDFVHVPLVPWPWPVASQAVGKALAEFLASAPYGLVGDDDAPLGISIRRKPSFAPTSASSLTSNIAIARSLLPQTKQASIHPQ